MKFFRLLIAALALSLLVMLGCGTPKFQGGGMGKRQPATQSKDPQNSTDQSTSDSTPTTTTAETSRNSGERASNASSVDVGATTAATIPPGTASIPKPAPASRPCSPKGTLPVGFAITFDEQRGGLLTLQGNSQPHTLKLSGRNTSNEVLFNDGDAAGGATFSCVTSLIIRGGPADDTFFLGGPLKGIQDLAVYGEAGNDRFTLQSAISVLGNFTVDGGN